MKYQEFIDFLNNGKINQINFGLINYAHYKNCTIKVEKSINIKPNSNEKFSQIIIFELTQDKSETITFYGKYNEKEKIFLIKGKGKFTLKEIWKNIEIKEIIYN